MSKIKKIADKLIGKLTGEELVEFRNLLSGSENARQATPEKEEPKKEEPKKEEPKKEEPKKEEPKKEEPKKETDDVDDLLDVEGDEAVKDIDKILFDMN